MICLLGKDNFDGISSYNESFSLGFTSYAFDHYKKDIMLHMQMPLRFTPPLDGEEGVG